LYDALGGEYEIEIREETMSLSYRSERRKARTTNFSFLGNKRKKGMLSKKTHNIFCPVGATP